MQHGCIQTRERAESEQLRGVELPHGAELLPAARGPAAAHEAAGHGPERGAAATLRR